MDQASAELWVARVFGSPSARGMSVALVRSTGARAPVSFSALAGDLGHDVTAFLLPGADGRWTQLAYSGTRRLSASAAALLVAGAANSAGRTSSVETPAGQATVLVDDAGLVWARLPTVALSRGEPLAPLASALGRARLPGCAPDVVVRGPVARCYREVPDPAALQLVDLARDRAWSYLRHEGLDAICLYARVGPDELALRVFSSACCGGEESVSPGVLGGLSLLLDTSNALTIQQGRGAPRFRGTLLLKDGAVGGRVRLLSRGALLQEAWGHRRAC